jgi:hypothetical protein
MNLQIFSSFHHNRAAAEAGYPPTVVALRDGCPT